VRIAWRRVESRPIMAGRSAPALLALAAAALPGAAAAGEPAGGPAAIVGGELASSCDWPSVVMLDGGGVLCTGTLVSSRIVLYAAHCGVLFERVIFGQGLLAGYFAPVTECRRFAPEDGVTPDDYAYCELARPINGVPIAPVLYGCETETLTSGREVVIVGFGEDDDGNIGNKRWAETTFNGVDVDGMLKVGGAGTSAAQGDSGGPAFVQLDDGSWRVFGIVSGGTEPGQQAYYVDMSSTVAWVEETSGYDITPCHDADGTWNPGYECGGFATEPMAGGTWDEQCSEEDPLSGRSSSCGASHPADPDEPEVRILTPEGGAVLDTAPSDVTVEIDASDATSAVRRVWLSIDGELREEDVTEPWRFDVHLRRGTYSIRALAEDEGGNTGASDEQELYVGEEPGGGCLGCRAGGGGGGAGAVAWILAALAGAWRLARPRRRR
jgi:hypothetical protein